MPTDPLHRWGKLNSGQVFHVLAADIDRALSFAMLTGYEVALMEQVRERCWAEPSRARRGRGEPWPDARPCRINLTQLEKDTGIPRQRFSRAKAGLIRSRILIENGEEISINKAAHEWVFPETGEPRLSPQILAFCDSARPKTQAQFEIMSEQENSEHFLAQGDSKSVQGGEHFLSRGVNGKPFGQRTEKCSGGEQKSVHPPIEDRARGIRELDREREKTPLTPRRGERGREPRPTKGQGYELDRRRQVEAIRLRRALEAEKGGDRG